MPNKLQKKIYKPKKVGFWVGFWVGNPKIFGFGFGFWVWVYTQTQTQNPTFFGFRSLIKNTEIRSNFGRNRFFRHLPDFGRISGKSLEPLY
jgi:hypothetical protein